MRLFVDDKRDAPEGWVLSRTFKEAKTVIMTAWVTGNFEALSLDHDLGGKKTGYDLVNWIAENDYWPDTRPMIHSGNPVGRMNIERAIDADGPY